MSLRSLRRTVRRLTLLAAALVPAPAHAQPAAVPLAHDGPVDVAVRHGSSSILLTASGATVRLWGYSTPRPNCSVPLPNGGQRVLWATPLPSHLRTASFLVDMDMGGRLERAQVGMDCRWRAPDVPLPEPYHLFTRSSAAQITTHDGRTLTADSLLYIRRVTDDAALACVETRRGTVWSTAWHRLRRGAPTDDAFTTAGRHCLNAATDPGLRWLVLPGAALVRHIDAHRSVPLPGVGAAYGAVVLPNSEVGLITNDRETLVYDFGRQRVELRFPMPTETRTLALEGPAPYVVRVNTPAPGAVLVWNREARMYLDGTQRPAAGLPPPTVPDMPASEDQDIDTDEDVVFGDDDHEGFDDEVVLDQEVIDALADLSGAVAGRPAERPAAPAERPDEREERLATEALRRNLVRQSPGARIDRLDARSTNQGRTYPVLSVRLGRGDRMVILSRARSVTFHLTGPRLRRPYTRTATGEAGRVRGWM